MGSRSSRCSVTPSQLFRHPKVAQVLAQVLQVIYNLLKEHLHINQSIIADLHDLAPYVFPPHRAKTDLRPDIVVWNDTTRSVTLLELTVCHESNSVEAYQRKVTHYLELEDEIHFRVKTIPIQVGCRGFVDIESFKGIKQLITCSLGIESFFKIILWPPSRHLTVYGQVGIIGQYLPSIFVPSPSHYDAACSPHASKSE